MPLDLRLRIGEVTLRVGRDRRPEPGQELLRRHAGNVVVLLFIATAADEFGQRDRLTDAATVLARRPFGRDQLRRSPSRR